MHMFQPQYTRPLPADATVVEKDGKPHVKLREEGRTVYYPLSKDGKKYLKRLDMWYAKVTLPNGKVDKVPSPR